MIHVVEVCKHPASSRAAASSGNSAATSSAPPVTVDTAQIIGKTGENLGKW